MRQLVPASSRTGVCSRKHLACFGRMPSFTMKKEARSMNWPKSFRYVLCLRQQAAGFAVLTLIQEFFANELKQAKAVVQEPAQPKIKLKVQQPAPEQPTTSKKITIHVGGKSDSADSPAPSVFQSAGSQVNEPTPTTSGSTRRTIPTVMPAAMDRLRSTSAASPSPSVANNIKREDAARPSPAVTPGHVGTPSGFPPPAQAAGLSNAHFQPIGTPQPQPQANGIQQPQKPLWDQKNRAPGKGT